MKEFVTKKYISIHEFTKEVSNMERLSCHVGPIIIFKDEYRFMITCDNTDTIIEKFNLVIA